MNTDIRNLSKWLNEEQEAPIDRKALARVLAMAEQTAQQEPVEMSPEFTDTARSALLWVLWHHQGGSSPVGQPIRSALGMGAHERLNDVQISEAKKWAKQTNATTAEFHHPAQQEPGDSLLLCASDLEHSAIHDNHRDMQSCIRAVALRIKTLAAPQPAQRKPLTDDEIENILPDDDTPMSLGEAFVKFARAIEAAHGIFKDEK